MYIHYFIELSPELRPYIEATGRSSIREKMITSHFKTITKHRHLVRKYCFRLGLYRQGLFHDLSKYSLSEFWRGARFYQGTHSPNDAERKETGVSLAWLHHKGRNKHHLEYWIDYYLDPTVTPGMIGYKMPERYMAEMFCDRLAAY